MTRHCWEQAARRHERDAQTLLSATPPAYENADQLYGYCADSVVNIVADVVSEAQGLRFAPTDKVHINARWAELAVFRQTPKLTEHLKNLPRSNPFSDWHVNQRYACDHKISKDVVEKHKQAASKLLSVLESLQVAGIVKKSL